MELATRELIVEVLGTTNNVLERQKYDQATIAIGRGYANDVIINDEHADADHAVLEMDADGDWYLVDRGSVNGIRRLKSRKRIDRTAVKSGEVFVLGRNKLRIFFGNHPVPPAVRIRLIESFLLWLGKPLVLVSMIIAYLAVKLAASYFTTIGELSWSSFLRDNLTEALLFVALAVAVYFLSVLFRRGGNFLSHLSVLVAVFLLGAFFDFLLRLAVFNAGDHQYGLISGFDTFSGYLVFFLYLWSVLYLAFHLSLKRRTWISLAVVGLFVLLSYLQEQIVDDWFDTESFPLEQALLPSALLLSEPITAEDYAFRTQAVFDRVDELRIEALGERDEPEPTDEDHQRVSDSPTASER